MDLWSQATKKAHDIQNSEMMLNEERQRGGGREKLLAAQDSPGVPGEKTPQQKWREKLHCPFAELTPKWISIPLSQLQSFFFSWSPDHCHHVLCILKLPPLFCKEQSLLDRALPKRLKSSQHILWKICRDKLPKQNPCVNSCKTQNKLRASSAVLSMWPYCKNKSHIQVLVICFFPTPPIKLKLGLQIGMRLLIATHLDKSNYMVNQKQRTVNK